MCSLDLLRIVPTMMLGRLPVLVMCCVFHGRDMQSEIMVSDTRRESVSFQRPDRSTVSSGSMRVTCFPLEQPRPPVSIAAQSSTCAYFFMPPSSLSNSD